MAYNSYYPATYQQPMMYAQQMPAPQSAQHNGVTWVQGEVGARAYPVDPGKSVMLLDSDESRFYIKSADSSGMPLPLRIFSYTEEVGTQSHENRIDTSQFVTREEFNQWKASQRNRRDKNE